VGREKAKDPLERSGRVVNSYISVASGKFAAPAERSGLTLDHLKRNKERPGGGNEYLGALLSHPDGPNIVPIAKRKKAEA